ncbi:MAG: hypothetical protein OJF60_001641 [Burkholderiaceae bacterium]|nr:MAG: hypothetical protein OJF60_001641 [Burkholderiaceae bacterium]
MGLLAGAIVIAGFEWSHQRLEAARRVRVARARAAAITWWRQWEEPRA